MKNRDWIVLDMRTTTFECLRCGKKYTPNLPCPLDMMSAMMNSFIKDHKGCKEQKNARKIDDKAEKTK